MAKLVAFLGGIVMGGIAGAALGILAAPKAGSELREDLVEVSDNLYRKAAYEIEELAEKVDDLKQKLDVQDFAPMVHGIVKPAQKAVRNAQVAMDQAAGTIVDSQDVIRENAL